MGEKVLKRFWDKVNKTDGCWIWLGSRTPLGYGTFWNGKCNSRAHRFSWEILVGNISEGLTLDHLCRNRACVNPAHLEPVTHRENVLRGFNACADNAQKEFCSIGWALILPERG